MSENKNTYEQISGHKECPQCGAANDPISSQCRFCQTFLPRLDFDVLREELLIKNCAIWLARFESLSEEGVYRAAKALDANRKKGVLGKLFTSGSEGEPGFSEIIANADRYITALETSSRISLELVDVVQCYKQRREGAKVELTVLERRLRSGRKLGCRSGCLLIFLAPILLSLPFIPGQLQKIEDARKEENARLQNIAIKASQAIARKDYTAAREFINQISWSIPNDLSSEQMWDRKRKEMLSAVERVSDNSKQ